MSAVQIGLVPQVPQMFGASHRARLSLALDHHACPASVPSLKRTRKDLDQPTKLRIGGSGSTTPTTPTHSKPWFRTVEVSDLCNRLTGPASTTQSQQFLVLDCRSFVSYNALHIRSSYNVSCGDRINRRRLQSGKVGVEDLISCREARDLLRKKTVSEVIIYDDSTVDIDLNSSNSSHPLLLIVTGLLELKKEPIILRGGMKQFQLHYPNLCESNLNSCRTSASSPGSVLISPPRTPCSVYDIDNYPATQVLPHVYLGNEKDASCGLNELREKNIGYILNVTTHLPGYHDAASAIKYKRIPAADSAHQNLVQFFEEAVHFIDEAKAAGKAVLVHCQGGVSRSPTITIAYLMYHSRLTLVDAYTIVKNLRPVISPNLNFMGQLLEYEASLSKSKLNQKSVD